MARASFPSPRMARVTLAGPELEGFEPGLPAASVRLLLPRPAEAEGAAAGLAIPHWDGNEFLYDDGERPPIRTLTPLRFDPDALELDLEVVLHGEGPLSTWAASAAPGDRVAVSGTGRGYVVDPAVRCYLLAGDESALPAMGVLLGSLPEAANVEVHVEVADPSARIGLPRHPGATVHWHDLAPGARPGDALAPAIAKADLAVGVRVWAAGEAAAVQRIRRHLFEERGLPREQTNIRGYWKVDRSESQELLSRPPPA